MNRQAVDRKVLGTVLRYGPARVSTLPVLRSVRVDTDRAGAWARVTTNNLEWQASLTLPGAVDAAPLGSVVIEKADAVAFPLARVVERVDGLAVLSPVEGSAAAVNVRARAVEEFPAYPQPSRVAASISGDWSSFVDALRFVLPSLSDDMTRPSLMGARVEFKGLGDALAVLGSRRFPGPVVVGTDGHRLHVTAVPYQFDVESYGVAGPYPCTDGDAVLIPSGLVDFLLRFPAVEGTFSLHLGDGSLGLVVVRDDGGEFPVITFRPVEGPYPDYRCVIPKASAFKHTLFVEDAAVKSLRDTLAAASRAQSAGLTKGRVLHPVKVEPSARGLAVSFRDGDGVGVSLGLDLPAVPPFGAYGFNARYLVDALAGYVEGGGVTFRFDAPDRGVLVAFGDGSRFALVMPLRLVD